MMSDIQTSAPISTHRLFPAIVALWFATLFGLGCAVLPGSMFERIVMATGLPSILPAAAPPLGNTARIAFSLAAALGGVVLGYVLALRVASLQGVARTPVQHTQRQRRPLYAKEELDVPLFDAPLPGDSGESEPAIFTPPPSPPLWEEDAQAPEMAEEESWQDTEPEVLFEPEPGADLEQAAMIEPEPEPLPDYEPGPVQHSDPPMGRLPADLPLDQMGIVQLAERLGTSLQKRIDAGLPVKPPPPEVLAMLGLAPQPETLPAVRRAIAEATPAPDDEELSFPQQMDCDALRSSRFGLDAFGEEESGDVEDGYEAEEVDGEAYASLLGVKPVRLESPAGTAEPFARRQFDDPEKTAQPVSPASHRNSDTGEALRSALARLQRLSGAA